MEAVYLYTVAELFALKRKDKKKKKEQSSCNLNLEELNGGVRLQHSTLLGLASLILHIIRQTMECFLIPFAGHVTSLKLASPNTAKGIKLGTHFPHKKVFNLFHLELLGMAGFWGYISLPMGSFQTPPHFFFLSYSKNTTIHYCQLCSCVLNIRDGASLTNYQMLFYWNTMLKNQLTRKVDVSRWKVP